VRYASTREPIDGRGMPPWVLALVEPIVLHAGFLGRLNHGQVRLTATPRAAKGLAAIIDFLKATDARRGIAPANVAAHPHRAERFARTRKV
jgi:hypothetical protein